MRNTYFPRITLDMDVEKGLVSLGGESSVERLRLGWASVRLAGLFDLLPHVGSQSVLDEGLRIMGLGRTDRGKIQEKRHANKLTISGTSDPRSFPLYLILQLHLHIFTSRPSSVFFSNTFIPSNC
jgi:hypothetical protein